MISFYRKCPDSAMLDSEKNARATREQQIWPRKTGESRKEKDTIKSHALFRLFSAVFGQFV